MIQKLSTLKYFLVLQSVFKDTVFKSLHILSFDLITFLLEITSNIRYSAEVQFFFIKVLQKLWKYPQKLCLLPLHCSKRSGNEKANIKTERKTEKNFKKQKDIGIICFICREKHQEKLTAKIQERERRSWKNTKWSEILTKCPKSDVGCICRWGGSAGRPKNM